LAVIAPSKLPLPEEEAGAVDAGEDESELAFFGELLHALTSAARKRSESWKMVRGDWGISLVLETANRVIESPCVESILECGGLAPLFVLRHENSLFQ